MISKFLPLSRRFIRKLLDTVGSSSAKEVLLPTSISKLAIQGIGNQFQGYVYIDSECTLGNYNYIGQYSAISKAKIGNYCSIATNVSIGMGEHSVDAISTSSLFYGDPLKILTEKTCEIGNDVWIGVDSIILRGVKVGNGAVVGANSVVTKDVPDFGIVVGSPARLIRFRFTVEEINRITESNWWDIIDLDEAKKMVQKLTLDLKKRDVF